MNNIADQMLPTEEHINTVRSLYQLMDKQVKSYQKQHRICSTSVPVGLAQELLSSLKYTLSLANGHEIASAVALEKGQAILAERYDDAWRLFQLVEATAPSWQGECRWGITQEIRVFLSGYDLKHLAHRRPDPHYYPFITSVPDDLAGIDCVIHMLKALWYENQIMYAASADMSDELWEIFCQNDRGISENQCEQLIINAIGKQLLDREWSSFVFSPSERMELKRLLGQFSNDELMLQLSAALRCLLAAQEISDDHIIQYVFGAVRNVTPRLEAALKNGNLAHIFL